MTRSSGVRNRALAGESGKNSLETDSELGQAHEVIYAPKEDCCNDGYGTEDDIEPAQISMSTRHTKVEPFDTHHCHGAKLVVVI